MVTESKICWGQVKKGKFYLEIYEKSWNFVIAKKWEPWSIHQKTVIIVNQMLQSWHAADKTINDDTIVHRPW